MFPKAGVPKCQNFIVTNILNAETFYLKRKTVNVPVYQIPLFESLQIPRY